MINWVEVQPENQLKKEKTNVRIVKILLATEKLMIMAVVRKICVLLVTGREKINVVDMSLHMDYEALVKELLMPFIMYIKTNILGI